MWSETAAQGANDDETPLLVAQHLSVIEPTRRAS
jgi:hypothetical protein